MRRLRFRRDSIFSSLQEHGSPTVEFAITVSTSRRPGSTTRASS